MKKIFSLLMVLFLSLCLLSCKDNKPVDNEPLEEDTNQGGLNQDNGEENNQDNPNEDNGEENNQEGPSETLVEIHFNFDDSKIKASDAFKNYGLSYDPSELDSKVKVIEDVLTNTKGLDELNKAYDELSNYNSKINDLYSIVEVLYYADDSSEEITKEYVKLYEYILDISTKVQEIDHEIANSIYAKDFFSGYTEEEIAELAENEVDNSELNSLLVKKKELNDKYSSATSKASKNKILKEYVDTNKQLAVVQGYEENEYIKYSDTFDYFRLYDSTAVDSFISYVKKYLLDLTFDVYDIDLRPETTAEQRQYNVYSSGKFLENKELFDEYVKTVGGTYEEGYNYLFNEGYYLFSSYSSSSGMAFQNNSDNINLVFFGSGVQDLSTFAHEYGHYHASFLGADYYSYDFCETQSQSSEVLFRLYLDEINPGFSSTCYEEHFIFELLGVILDGAIVREYEEMLYTSNVTSLQDAWNEVNEEYNYWGYDDWYDIIIDYDNYYISYATSALATLLVYAYGKEQGFEAASKLYLDLVSYDGYGDISEALMSVNLADPFSEEAFIFVKETIERVMNEEWQ